MTLQISGPRRRIHHNKTSKYDKQPFGVYTNYADRRVLRSPGNEDFLPGVTTLTQKIITYTAAASGGSVTTAWVSPVIDAQGSGLSFSIISTPSAAAAHVHITLHGRYVAPHENTNAPTDPSATWGFVCFDSVSGGATGTVVSGISTSGGIARSLLSEDAQFRYLNVNQYRFRISSASDGGVSSAVQLVYTVQG